MLKTLAFSATIAAGAAANNRRYVSGEIKTKERFQYGKFRTRMQGSGKKGTVSAFFTYWEGTQSLPWNRSRWNEIDVELVPSIEANPFATNIIYSGR